MRKQLNAPFGKIILICSQRLTRHTKHQVYEIPGCTGDHPSPPMPHACLLLLRLMMNSLKPGLCSQNSEGGSPSPLEVEDRASKLDGT